jgi:choline dehydrogenase-like flavoprotein
VTDHYDAVVIGSGAGGGTLARTLAASGKRILLLERGNFLRRELPNWDPYQVLAGDRYVSRETWYDTAGRPFQPQVHYFVGGATKLYGAALCRLRPADFGAIAHSDGLSPAWPLSYDEFEPWYAKAEWLYQVRGLHGEDPSEGPWSEEYLWPPVSHEPLVQQLADDLDHAGYHPFHMPRGVMLDEANPPASLCIRCDTCEGYPCLVHAKADADVIAVRPLLSRLNVTVLVDAEVIRLETDGRGRSVTKVIVRRGGAREEYRGDLVILAAGAINSAKVLLRSASDRHPAGLANGSGQVGRNLMCHHSTDVLAFGEKANETVFQQTLGINAFYLADESRRSSYPGGSSRRWPLGGIQLLGRSDLLARRLAAPWGALDAPDIEDRAICFRLTTEDLPRPDNRVTLDRRGRPHLAYRATNRGEAAMLQHEFETMLSHAHLHVGGEETLPAAGVSGVGMSRAGVPPAGVPRGGVPPAGVPRAGVPRGGVADQAGTCRFGTDPATSVLDVDCKAHELDNLYVADASFLPSVGALGPALTTMANAIRVGEHLVRRLR